ncbi:MAG TPA: MG2 domain-containing protein, partial [Pyrinomonadaceae bacterium]|nr:MG2 domain-containing protein [Pyrinomonadaceae bacterium]
MRRRRRRVILLACLFIAPLLFNQLTRARATLRVDEAATRFLFETDRTGAALSVENSTGRDVAARVRVELIDPQGRVRAEAARQETIKRGRTTLFVALAFRPTDLAADERKQLIWYRLRYTLAPQDSKDDDAQTSGVVSLSNITPGLFELRVAASSYVREGAHYRARARATHPQSGVAIEDVAVEAQLKIEEEDEERVTVLKASGQTDREGYATLDFELPPKINTRDADLKVTGQRGALVQEAQDSIMLDHAPRFLVSTDKPLYQPGQTLHARVLIFSPSRQAVAGAETPFKVADPEGSVVFRSRLVTSRFGVASADWPIPENARLGDYTITFGDDDGTSYTTRKVKVSRYDLPNFTAEVKPDRPFYLPGQDAAVEVSAHYLFGRPVRRGRVRVVRETERTWNYREQKWEIEEGDKYEAEADDRGRAKFLIKLAKEHKEFEVTDWSQFKDVTYAAYFTDASTGRTEQRRFDLRVTKEPIHVYLVGDIYGQSSRLPLEFYLSTFYADGTPAQCEVVVSEILKHEDEDDDEKPGERETRRLGVVSTNSYGLAKVTGLRPSSIEESIRKYLRLSARDARGAQGHRDAEVYLDDKPAVRVTTDKVLYRPHEPVNVQVVSSEKDLGLVVVDVSRDAEVLRSEVVRLTEGRGSISVRADDRFRDEITVTATADLAPRDSVSDSHTVLYPRRRDLQLDVRPASDKYRPGEEAHVNFQVRSPAGSAAEGALGVVVFDRAVEERARTDREFGSGYNFYGNYGDLLGWDESLAGVTRSALDRIDLSQPPPADLSLLAEVILNRTDNYYPNTVAGEGYEMSQPAVFAKLVNAQLAPALDALNARYAARVEYPADEESLRRFLAAAGIQFDSLRDPWGTPYSARFSVEKETDVLRLMSAGADKRFGTDDDFVAAAVSRPYFRKTGEAIDRAVRKYHERTGGYVRDAATLRAALLDEGIDLDTLRDRWGRPYALNFSVNQVTYVINVRSGGPNRVLDRPSKMLSDDFSLWSSTIDYFAETRASVDAALNSYLKETRGFPTNVKSLRAALARSGLNFDALRDPWGHAYYATFRIESRYADRVITQAVAGQGQLPQPRMEVQPVTQLVGVVTIRSAGADGREGTADDFDAGLFSLTMKEQVR